MCDGCRRLVEDPVYSSECLWNGKIKRRIRDREEGIKKYKGCIRSYVLDFFLEIVVAGWGKIL